MKGWTRVGKDSTTLSQGELAALKRRLFKITDLPDPKKLKPESNETLTFLGFAFGKTEVMLYYASSPNARGEVAAYSVTVTYC